MEIQNAYYEGNLVQLLKACNKYNISIDLTESDFQELQRFIDRQKRKIDEIKTTVRWAWCISDRSEAAREEILRSLGTSTIEIIQWRNDKIVKKKKEEAAEEIKQRQARRKAREKSTPYINSVRRKDLEKQRRRQKQSL